MKQLILRCNSVKNTSYGDFQWPGEVGAVVEAPDWQDDNECGHGLHGWLHGIGDGPASSYIADADAKWLVVSADEIVELGGKVKFPRCTIEFIGDKKAATDYLLANDPQAVGQAVIGAFVTAGDYGTATAGDCGTATAGDRGTIQIKFWTGERHKIKTGYIGEDGLLPNVPYKLNDQFEFEAQK